MTYLFEKATNGYFWKSSAQHLWSLEDILARLNVGGYPEANTLRPIVFAVAVPTEDLALPLAKTMGLRVLASG
jgi:hypothetical protein